MAATTGGFFVAANGDDSNSGTAERPFATLAQARDAARASTGGKTIWLRGGDYTLLQTLDLTAADSGLTIRSVDGEKVRLSGGRALSAKDFRAVTNEATLARIAPEAKGKILELDLAALGVVHRKACPDLFNDNGGTVELFVGGRRMPLSRYPNEGYMTMKRVLFNGGGQSEQGRWGDKNLKQSANGPGVFEYRDDRHPYCAAYMDRP